MCLTRDPDFLDGVGSQTVGRSAQIVGIEYENYNLFLDTIGQGDLHNQDAPCAVCEVPRTAVLMVPSKRTCPQGWTMEYEGLLMAQWWNHEGKGEYECVSLGMETVEGGYANNDGAHWYVVETLCGKSLPCPPYEDGFELSCVVCTK